MMAQAVSSSPIFALAFDFGTQKIGLAYGQSALGTAAPVGTIHYKKIDAQLWQNINHYVEQWSPTHLIVGLPYNMDGTNSALARLSKSFAKQLADHTQLPTHLHDERLSTRAARWQLDELHDNSQKSLTNKKNTKKNRKKATHSIDALAAAVLLESWLNHIKPR